MSNYLNAPLQYSNTIDSSAVDLFGRVATMKQQKYDANQNQLQQTLDQYGAMAQNLRAKGQEYLAGKLQAVTQYVNSSAQNRDLSKSGVARAINSQIDNIVRDPILINEIAQSQKIASFNKEVSQLKTKSPDKYDDGNYQDALNLAGVQQFMSGETDAVGNLVYHEYINLPQKYNKLAQDFAKDTGVEQYLGTQRLGDAAHPYDRNTFGKRVSIDSIQNHLLNSMDAKDMAQLQINARREIGGDANAYMSIQLNDENAVLQDKLTRAQADLKSMPEDEAAQYAPAIQDLKSRIESNKDKIKLGQFNPSDAYQAYTNRLTRNIAGQYDLDIITKFETDKMPYEMAKDDRDYALQLEKFRYQQQKDLLDRQDKTTAGQQASVGTATDVARPLEDKEQSDFTNIRQETHRSASALDAYLLTADPVYKDMNAQERWNYKLNLNAENPKIKGNTAEYRNLVENFQNSQRQYANIVGTASNGIKDTTTNVFNEMLAGKNTSDLNIRNLSITMPLTAAMLGRNDIASFNNLSPAQKLGVMAEFASNNLQFNNNLTGDVRTAYERSVTDFKSKLEGLKTTDSKIVLDTIKNSSKSFSPTSENTSIVQDVIGGFRGIYSSLFQDAPSPADSPQVRNALAYRDFQRQNLGNVFSSDTNITEIQARDLRGELGAKAQFDIQNERLSKLIQDKAAIYTKTINENKAFSFSTEDKGQKSIAQALEAAVLNSSEAPRIPVSNNTYTLQKEGKGWRISYNADAEKKGKERASVYVSTLPPAVSSTFDQTQQQWKNSPYNPDIKLAPQVFTPETNAAKRNREVKNISENLTDALSQQMIAQLETNPSNSPFMTTIEFGQQILKERGTEFFQRNQDIINNILNSQYTAVPKVTSDPANPFWVDIHYTDPVSGQEVISSQPLIGAEKNNSSFYIQYAKMIYDLKYNAINNLNG